MKSPYFFGYLFVRIGKAIAIFALLCGVMAAAVGNYQIWLQIEAVRYRDDTELSRALENMRQQVLRSQDLVLSAHNDTVFPSQFVAAGFRPDFQPLINSGKQFEVVGKKLAQCDGANIALKEFLTVRFNTKISEIRGILVEHARRLEKENGSASVLSAAKKPAPTNVQSPDTSELFASLDWREIEKRVETLKLSGEFLGSLRDSSENPENQRRLQEALDELKIFEKLLPIPSVTQSPKLISAKEPETPERKVLNAERVAIQLEGLQSEIHRSIARGWLLDEALAVCRNEFRKEEDKFRLAQLSTKGLWVKMASSSAALIGAGLLIGFLLMVFADLVKSLLDTATNTGVVASLYSPDEG